MKNKIIMLVGKDHSSYAMYNELKKKYDISHILLEDSPNKINFLKRRIKKLGFTKVCGQILFLKLIVPFLKWEVNERKKEIINKYNLLFTQFEEEKIIKLKSINSTECIEKLNEISPNIIIVNGTRIISRKVLNSTTALFINTHTGITPLYRGVHGAYWSKINKDNHCGVSVHLIDEGIDTGGILHQERIETNDKDNFISYTYLQLGVGIKLMKEALNDILQGEIRVVTNNLESKIWSHPTIWFYIKHRIFDKIK